VPTNRVLIAGGGPVGLITALVLGRAGVAVSLFEAGDLLHQEPRAATIHAATLDQLDDLGVYRLLEPQGLVCPIVHYYDGHPPELIAAFDHALLDGEVRHPWVLQCEQDKLARTVVAMLAEFPSVQVHPRTRLLSFEQDADGVRATVQRDDAPPEIIVGDFLVGADGARSIVRKQAGIAFEGITYPERFAIIGTPYDFTRHGYAERNYISDPVEWYNLFRISWTGPPGVFRLVVPIRADELTMEPAAQQELGQRKLQRFHPCATPYEVVIFDSYVVNQRVAAGFRLGRVLLAGDAAHLNSPIGGMGMNSGIHDAVNLGSALARVVQGSANDDALDCYDRQRRFVATTHVQAATLINKRNMEQRDPAQRQRYRDEMRRIAGSPKLAKDYLMRSSLVQSLRDAAQIA
jgi:3-(3-hydroxy-phenyl)propionate hydroxylase